MKKILLFCFLFPFSVTAQNATEKNAQAWAATFSQLVATRQWEQARTIAPIGEKHFQNTKIWSTQKFQNTWVLWQKGNAYSSWTTGKDQRSMWKLSEGNEENRPTLGVRKELDGSVWLLFARPATAPQWNCTSCTITITFNGRSQRWTVRSPNKQSLTSVLGMTLPPSLFVNAPRVWNVEFPDGSKEIFDVSYTPLVCGYKVSECTMLWNPTL